MQLAQWIMEDLGSFGDLKIWEQVQYCEQFTANLVLLGKEEAVVQGMTVRLIATGRCYGIEMNVEKSWGDENLKATILNTDHKQV